MNQLAAILVNVGVPFALLLLFKRFLRETKGEKKPQPSQLALAAILISYGNWIVALLTALILRGGVIQGVMFMILVSFSILALPCAAVLLYKNRETSPRYDLLVRLFLSWAQWFIGSKTLEADAC